MKAQLHRFGEIVPVVLLAVFLLASCGTPGGSVTPPGQDDIRGRATVDRIDILVLESFPVQVNVSIQGSLSDSCTEIDTVTQRKDLEKKTFWVEITTTRPKDAVCAQVITAFHETVSLDAYGLPAGTYTADVNGVRGTFTLSINNRRYP